MLGSFERLDLIDVIGFVGVAANLFAFYVSDIVRLRASALVSNVFLLIFAVLRGSAPNALQHAILMPLNAVRLWQMHKLIRDVRVAAGDFSMDWLKPFMSERTAKAGSWLFREGDEAREAFFILAGEVRLAEIAVSVGPGALLGEMGLFSPERRRMASARCVGDVRLLYISYEDFERLCFQNPRFSFYLMRLIVTRLEANARAGRPSSSAAAI